MRGKEERERSQLDLVVLFRSGVTLSGYGNVGRDEGTDGPELGEAEHERLAVLERELGERERVAGRVHRARGFEPPVPLGLLSRLRHLTAGAASQAFRGPALADADAADAPAELPVRDRCLVVSLVVGSGIGSVVAVPDRTEQSIDVPTGPGRVDHEHVRPPEAERVALGKDEVVPAPRIPIQLPMSEARWGTGRTRA